VFLRARRHWTICLSEEHRHIPKLLLIGTEDQFASAEHQEEAVRREQSRGAALEIHVLPGADHFHPLKKGSAEAKAVTDWIAVTFGPR